MSASLTSTDKTAATTPGTFTRTLGELMEEGIYLLFLLRNGQAPKSHEEFHRRVGKFLAQFETNAHNLSKPASAIEDAKYAFCAAMDEIILASSFSIRPLWERSPLQLRLFGEHLAGEHFFDKLEKLRVDPVINVDVLEVFYTMLLLGFQGKYIIEGTEKLDYLISRLGQEITHARGGRNGFAPNWNLPHKFQSYVRNDLPLWLFFALLGLIACLFFFSFRWWLSSGTETLVHKQKQPAMTKPISPPAQPDATHLPSTRPRTST